MSILTESLCLLSYLDLIVASNEHIIFLNCFVDGSSSSVEDAVLSRLAETGATESSSTYSSSKHMEEDTESPREKTKTIERNIEASIENLWYLKDGLHATLLNELPKDGMIKRQHGCLCYDL